MPAVELSVEQLQWVRRLCADFVGTYDDEWAVTQDALCQGVVEAIDSTV